MSYSYILCPLLCHACAISGGYGWQYFRCYPCLIQHVHSASFMYIMYHSPHLLLFVFGAAMRGHLIRTAIFVPHITPVRTICPAAPVNSYFIVYHLWWYVFYGIVKAKRLFYLKFHNSNKKTYIHKTILIFAIERKIKRHFQSYHIRLKPNRFNKHSYFLALI